MKTSYCQEVRVKFLDKHRQDVVVSYAIMDTRSRYLKVESDGLHIAVKHCDKDGDTVKEVVFNFSQVLEFDCYGWVNPEIVKGVK